MFMIGRVHVELREKCARAREACVTDFMHWFDDLEDENGVLREVAWCVAEHVSKRAVKLRWSWFDAGIPEVLIEEVASAFCGSEVCEEDIVDAGLAFSAWLSATGRIDSLQRRFFDVWIKRAEDVIASVLHFGPGVLDDAV